MEHKPDAILMDLQMPKRSGLGSVPRVGGHQQDQPIPIFVVSGETGPRNQGILPSNGRAGYFEKPVDFDALRNSLAKVKRQTQVPRSGGSRASASRTETLAAPTSTEKNLRRKPSPKTSASAPSSALVRRLCRRIPCVEVYIVEGSESTWARHVMVRSEERAGNFHSVCVSGLSKNAESGF